MFLGLFVSIAYTNLKASVTYSGELSLERGWKHVGEELERYWEQEFHERDKDERQEGD